MRALLSCARTTCLTPTFACVASGWEKGVVEKNVQDSRRRIWLDAQQRQFGSFAELNAWLGERCRSLWSEIRHPEYKHFSVAEVLEQERSELMPMPTPFDGYVERSAKVSSTCLVAVARNRYSVPSELAGQRVSTRLYPSRVEIASDEAIVASHERLADRGHICYDWSSITLRWYSASPAPCATAPPLPTCRHPCNACVKG